MVPLLDDTPVYFVHYGKAAGGITPRHHDIFSLISEELATKNLGYFNPQILSVGNTQP